MPRPTKDGHLPAPTIRVRVSDSVVKSAKPGQRRYLLHDTELPGFCVSVEPTGWKTFKLLYSYKGLKRWYNIGPVNVYLSTEARRHAREILGRVYQGTDPQGGRSADRHAATFASLVEEYLADPKVRITKARSLWQSECRLRNHVLPVWATRAVSEITSSSARLLHADLSKKAGPFAANYALAAASAVFSWAVRCEKALKNPCHKLEYNPANIRKRVLSTSEIPKFWVHADGHGPRYGSALKMLLLTGQRPGEVGHMRWEHISNGWWNMPGLEDASSGWPGTKNKKDHRVWLSKPARDILENIDQRAAGFVFASPRGKPAIDMDVVMRKISEEILLSPPVTPHDLRRTHGTTVTRLRFGRDAMNRIQNHLDGGIADVYDQYEYEPENIEIQEAVAAEFLRLVEADVAVGSQLPDVENVSPGSQQPSKTSAVAQR